VESARYGLGVSSGGVTGIGNQLGHPGGTIGWRSQMIYLPDRQITTTVLRTQQGGSTETALKNLQSTVQKY
jgi:hypothetical protein